MKDGTRKRRLVPRVGPCRPISASSSSGPTTPATSASQPNDVSADAVSGMRSDPSNGAQNAVVDRPGRHLHGGQRGRPSAAEQPTLQQ